MAGLVPAIHELHDAMMAADREPVIYTPDNEPYLGGESLLAFDRAIPRAMQVHTAIGPTTFLLQLSPLQSCAVEIVPRGVSIALSIRELIRQAYLFSAALLMRPLIERTGLIEYLVYNPEAVKAWQDGWPRKEQPSFDALFALVMPGAPTQHREQATKALHKLVHIDPMSGRFNLFTRPDGSLAFAAGKVLDRPDLAEAVAQCADVCLRRLTTLSAFIFEHDPEVSGEIPPSGGKSGT